MRFLFVDSISRRDEDSIEGSKLFGADSALVYSPDDSGAKNIAPGAVSEAIGQLASWLCIEKKDFSVRPIFLFADSIETVADVPLGSEVELKATLHSIGDETFVFSGSAFVGGEVVQTLTNCNGYFMPLGDLEDPQVARKRFESMESGGLTLADPSPGPFDFDSLLDRVVELERDQQVTVSKKFDGSEPFFADHFPRFPVTPIVMLNEMIGKAAKKMILGGKRKDLKIRKVESIKIRSFVKPGEEVQARVEVLSIKNSEVRTKAELIKDGKIILRGRYTYEWTI